MNFLQFFTDFGFETPIDPAKIDLGGENKANLEEKTEPSIFWTIFIYILLCLGIYSRNLVNFPSTMDGINSNALKVNILVASFIIGLAILAPLLRVISRFHNGRFTWQHCLTAFTIGFFGDMTFQVLLKSFFSLLNFVPQ